MYWELHKPESCQSCCLWAVKKTLSVLSSDLVWATIVDEGEKIQTNIVSFIVLEDEELGVNWVKLGCSHKSNSELKANVIFCLKTKSGLPKHSKVCCSTTTVFHLSPFCLTILTGKQSMLESLSSCGSSLPPPHYVLFDSTALYMAS